MGIAVTELEIQFERSQCFHPNQWVNMYLEKGGSVDETYTRRIVTADGDPVVVFN